MGKGKIRTAICGLGNCASALIQGIESYRHNPTVHLGLMHKNLGGYDPEDIEVVAAFDIDRRKVGRPLQEAIFAPPNCVIPIWKDLPDYGVTVHMGPPLDGVAPHMREFPPERTFLPADEQPVDVERVLKQSKAEIFINYLPVGSTEAVRYYAQCCLNSGTSLINCMPEFIASDPKWAKKFEQRGIPLIGDDIKSQVGATIIHRVLTHLFEERGVTIKRTYQLNTGGNTDFLNMLERSRLKNKKISKTEAVQSHSENLWRKKISILDLQIMSPGKKITRSVFYVLKPQTFAAFHWSWRLGYRFRIPPTAPGWPLMPYDIAG